MRTVPIAGILVLALLAGCSDSDADDVVVDVDPDALLSEDGRDLKVALTADDAIEGADWRPGQAWEQQLTFANGDKVSWTVMVAEDQGAHWLLAVDDPDVAAFESVHDYPVFGLLEKGSLATTSGGEHYTWYDFPLRDNRSWEHGYTTISDNGTVVDHDLTYVASYSNISTPLGQRPGFVVEGRTAAGELVVAYDHTPAVGWFSSFTEYDPRSGDVAYTIETTGVGEYSGAYYVSEAEQLVLHVNDVGSAMVAPHADFQVGEAADHLYGFIWSYAGGGGHATRLVAPDGSERGVMTGPDGLLGGSVAVEEFFEPAQAGDWQVVTAGAGAFAAGGGAWFFQVFEEERILALDAGME